MVDTASEDAFDDIVRLAATLCEAPAAAISLIDRDRVWFKARIGMDQPQTGRWQSLCDVAIRTPDRMLVVHDVATDPRFAGIGLRIGGRPLRFYAGLPLLNLQGLPVGTVCVLDVKPRELSKAQRDGLAVLARQIQHMFELRRYVVEQRRLLTEREAFARRLEDEQADLQRRHEQLQHSAHHDALTGLLNRAALTQMREDPEAMWELEREPYTLVLLDVDHFKRVNDQHGHLLGDRALRAVADAVAMTIREGDIAVRYGGEEFLVVLPATDLMKGKELAERIRQQVARSSLPFSVTVSAGVVIGQPGQETFEQAFERADQALYRAKASGRDCVVADRTSPSR